MQARMIREGEVVVVHLSGRVDVETAVPFRDVCLNRLSGNPVVLDFQSLSFVGSSGILPFLETMHQFHAKNTKGLKFSGVGLEFRKVFAATPLNVIEIHDSASLAVESFRNPAIVPQSVVQAVPLQGLAHPEAPQQMLSLTRDVPADVPNADIDDEIDA